MTCEEAILILLKMKGCDEHSIWDCNMNCFKCPYESTPKESVEALDIAIGQLRRSGEAEEAGP